jgi:RNA recognition motif-containing protein
LRRFVNSDATVGSANGDVDSSVTGEHTPDSTVTSDSTSGSVTTAASGSEAKSIYLGNVYFDVTEDQLRELCSQYGVIEKSTLMKDIRGFSRG